MVLYKRKPVELLQNEGVTRGTKQYWEINETGEIFTSHDEYSARLEFYEQPKFICQITGQSKLTFFEALKSEKAGAKEVQEAFPEALKGPVLRRVQFQTISRIDHLVDNIYDEFKSEFFPGEQVTAQISDTERIQGSIREKIRVGPKPKDDGSMSEPFSRYIITCDDRDLHEIVVDGPAVYRDRKIFTKAVLRTFIKNSVTREAWNGAPWIVKSEFADLFAIDTRIPQHLRHDHKLMERKQLQAAKRTTTSIDANGLADVSTTSLPSMVVAVPTPPPAPEHEPARLPDLKPKSHRVRPQLVANPMNFTLHPSYEPTYVSIPPSPTYMSISLRNNNPPLRRVQSPPPPPPPKYPIDDLDVGPRAGISRPKLKFMCSDPPCSVPDPQNPLALKVKMESIGPLLETWDTLNVYCEIFKLDSFTFDDYFEAMSITSLEVMPQLVQEIHCSVLKVLVGSESEGGRVEFMLPTEEIDSDELEGEDEEGDSVMGTPQPEKPTVRATRSSLAKMEAERVAAEAEQDEEPTETQVSKVEELMEGYDWIDNLRKRQFQAGGWQRIIAGLLHALSRNERKKAECDMILSQLVPMTVEATQDTVAENYAQLDVNLKVRIIQILCMLTTETKAVRAYMEDCSETMTQYRKDKIEWQRQRKQAVEDLRGLNEQRKTLAPENMPLEPSIEPEESKLTDLESSQVEEDTDEDGTARRSRRGGKKDERVEKKPTPVPKAPKAPKQSKQWIKLLKDIQKKESQIEECEREIAVIDNDLREADCPRTRCLGKDRFWNRYYWFERNGMPYGGLPNSSTASAAYANGCVWVQGPDELEREGYIDLPADLENEYKARFNMTVVERKRREEGETSVFNAKQWGFISEPSDLEDLIKYLDPRGVNELKLRKELVTYHEKIVMNMKNRKMYLGLPDGSIKKAETEEKEVKDEETKAGEAEAIKIEAIKAESETPVPASSSPSPEERRGKRSTRSKRSSQTPAMIEAEAEAAAAKEKQRLAEEEEERRRNMPPRCLAWENSVAMEELGHLHCEPPPAPKRKNNAKKRESAAATESEEPPRKTRRR